MNYDKLLNDIMKNYNPVYKPERIQVNISSTFMARAKCRECGEGPSYYYEMRLPFYWRNVRDKVDMAVLLRKWMSKITDDWYLDGHPRYFHKAQEFSYRLEGRAYNPAIHNTRNVVSGLKYNVVQVVGCDCGATVWTFNQKSVIERPEIVNRKGKYSYPKTFTY